MKTYYICEKDFHHIHEIRPFIGRCAYPICDGPIKEFISKEELKICIDAYLPEKIATEFDKGLVFLANRIINKIGAK